WELPVAEVVSSGSDRIIVYEGAEQKLKQLGTGLLEKMGIGGNSWEKEERDRWRAAPVPAENQLPAGQPSQQEQRRIQPARSRAFEPEEEMEYVELEERRQGEPLRQRRYLDDDGERGWEREERREPMPGPYRGEGRGWEPEDRGWDRSPEAPLDRREAERRRRPPAPESGQRPADRGRGSEPLDVEPEILDDPW
ncbi:MAG: photosystem reaction center subunit H, partial [Cyanobacteriota bacterium]